MKPTVGKVVCYVIDQGRVLVFRHQDHPEAGLQVPAGTIRPGEDPERAALREATEETGLGGLSVVRFLGRVAHDISPIREEIQDRHVFHLAPTGAVPEEWTHHERHDGEQPPTAFSFFWLPLGHPDLDTLAAGQGALLHRVVAAHALDWLADHAHENLGTEMALRRSAAGDAWHVTRSGVGGELTGVSVWTPGGRWFLEATGPEAVDDLVSVALRPDGGDWPTKVSASGTVKAWLRPGLLERGAVIHREHDLLAMACRHPPDGAEGRWATAADRPALERYQAAYNEERRTTTAPEWDTVLRHPAVAVLEKDGDIVAVVKRTADTARYATIAGTWTDPAHRHQGLAARLTAFILGRLLAERPAVHLVVDDDNTSAIALYRSLGFEEVGRCYMAYFAPPT